MKDIRKTTIDSILKDYFYAIDSSKLSDDNIDIDDTNVVTESAQKYIQLLASFLNEAYYMGYIMSESILNKLMNIIDYKGYEYQLMETYSNILMGSMNDNHGLDPNRPVYRQDMLSYEESKNYVMDYLNAVKNAEEINSTSFPHYKNPNSNAEDANFVLMFLNEVEYPIDRIYKDFENATNPVQIAEYGYILYKYNKPAYISLLDKTNNIYAYLFFLLDNEDDMSLDILVDNIITIPSLARLIDMYEYFDIAEIKYAILSEVANKNIHRLFEYLSTNVADEQLAMIIGLDIDIWTNYYEANNTNTIIDLSKLDKVIKLFNSDKKYNILNPVEYIYTIKDKYPDDVYFYARHCLLNMDYKLFFTEFLNIYNELHKSIDTKVLVDLCIECINDFKNLKVKEVDDKINELYVQLCYQTSNDNVPEGLMEIRNSIK